MSTQIYILVHDLPTIVNPKPFTISTIDKSVIISMFKDYADNPLFDVQIFTNINIYGTEFAYALVSFDDINKAIDAISHLQYTKIYDKEIHLKLWNDETKNICFSGEGKILIQNLPNSITESDLDSTLSDIGDVIDCMIPKYDKKSLSYAIIQFRDPEIANEVCERLDRSEFNGQLVRISKFVQKKTESIEDFMTNWQELLTFSGKNNFSQLSFQKVENIFPPISFPIQFRSLSYSIYSEHSVMITESGTAWAVGLKSDSEIIHSKSSEIECGRMVSLKISDEIFLSQFESAVCGDDYTLYLCKPTPEIDTKKRKFLVISTHRKSGEKVTVLNSEEHVPCAIYGGSCMCAAIDTTGTVMLVNTKSDNASLSFVFLPGSEQAVKVAFQQDKLIALSSTGYLYECTVPDGADEADFSIISEVSTVMFSDVSGTHRHCIAVTTAGDVFVRGANEMGCLGLKDHADKSVFTRVMKFQGNIASASAGFDHSLFISREGKVYACGSNRNGQMMIKTKPRQDGYWVPMITGVANASFAIAGNGLSVAFINSRPPKNSPNMVVDFRRVKFTQRKARKIKKASNEEASSHQNLSKSTVILSPSSGIEPESSAFEGDSDAEISVSGSDGRSDGGEDGSGSGDLLAERLLVDEIGRDVEQIDKLLDDERKFIMRLFDLNRSLSATFSNAVPMLCNVAGIDVSSIEVRQSARNNPFIVGVSRTLKFSGRARGELIVLTEQQWDAGTAKLVELLPSALVPVRVVDISMADLLGRSLRQLPDGRPMAVSFLWRWIPPRGNMRTTPGFPISVFQIASSRGVLIVLNSEEISCNAEFDYAQADVIESQGLLMLKSFFISHSFIGKKVQRFDEKLYPLFGQTFDFVDILDSRLTKDGKEADFYELFESVIGQSTINFKSMKHKKLRWNRRPLSVMQVCSAAFEVLALRLVSEHLFDETGNDENFA